jgi:hypothetical protein
MKDVGPSGESERGFRGAKITIRSHGQIKQGVFRLSFLQGHVRGVSWPQSGRKRENRIERELKKKI